MIYYRIAWKTDQSPVWRWKSTKLTSLEALFRLLRMYHMVPQDYLCVFSSTSLEYLNEMLICENNGWGSTSLTAEQFLRERGIGSIGMSQGASECREYGTRTSTGTLATTKQSLDESIAHSQPPLPSVYGYASFVTTKQSVGERIAGNQPEGYMNALDRRRLEVELGAGGDSDTPYTFALPTSMPQALTWIRLLVKVQHGELEP